MLLPPLLPTSARMRMKSLAVDSDATMPMQQAAHFRRRPSQDSRDSHLGGAPDWSVSNSPSRPRRILPMVDDDQHPNSCLSRPSHFQNNICQDPRVYFDESKTPQLPKMHSDGSLLVNDNMEWRVLRSPWPGHRLNSPDPFRCSSSSSVSSDAHWDEHIAGDEGRRFQPSAFRFNGSPADKHAAAVLQALHPRPFQWREPGPLVPETLLITNRSHLQPSSASSYASTESSVVDDDDDEWRGYVEGTADRAVCTWPCHVEGGTKPIACGFTSKYVGPPLASPGHTEGSCRAFNRKHSTKRHIETTHLKIKYVNRLLRCLSDRRFEWRSPF